MSVDGIITTFDAVMNKLDEPMPLGYSNVGEVIAIGDEISDYEVGDRVVSNGPHAEYVKVNKNLCTKIPKEVSDEEISLLSQGQIYQILKGDYLSSNLQGATNE